MTSRLGIFAVLLVLAVMFAGVAPRQPEAERHLPQTDSPQPATSTRFQAIDIFLDPFGRSLAAYQVEFRAVSGRIKIVGVEGGEHTAFRSAPYYDPAAMQNERVIIGALSTLTADQLPTIRTRIARIHVMIEGGDEPRFEVRLQTAAEPDAHKVDAAATFELVVTETPAAGERTPRAPESIPTKSREGAGS